MKHDVFNKMAKTLTVAAVLYLAVGMHALHPLCHRADSCRHDHHDSHRCWSAVGSARTDPPAVQAHKYEPLEIKEDRSCSICHFLRTCPVPSTLGTASLAMPPLRSTRNVGLADDDISGRAYLYHNSRGPPLTSPV